MGRSLRLLSVEDREDDEILILEELRDYGFDVSSIRVSTAEEMRRALEERTFDLVTSDHKMPKFNSRAALRVLKESGKDIPFLLVSGSIGELEAVELMRAGAHDYILKENVRRLGPAVDRELREALIRTEKNRADADLKNALADLDSLLKTAPAAIAYFDTEMKYVRVNDAMAEINGIPAEDSIGKRIFEVLPELGERLAPSIRQVLETGRPILNQEIQGSLPGGTEIVCSWLASFYPIRSNKRPEGQVVGTGVVIIDITERKDIQSRLEHAVRSRDDFLSIASHELKTPLTTLKIQCQTRIRDLERRGGTVFTEERLRKMFLSDARQLLRLERLIDEMLDVSRIQSGKLSVNLERLDLCALVREVVERMRPQVAESGSSLRFGPCESVWGSWDHHRIEQVCTNLLSNAARYGERKPIEVTVSCRGSVAEIAVIDQGRGIAIEDQERIFGQFERAIPGHEISGLGLGLYISQKIVESHHGSIRVESELGKGAKFLVSLPILESRESWDSGESHQSA